MERTQSIWEGTTALQDGVQPLEGNVETDVAIVGGGISGVTAASLLSRAGREVVLLEAGGIGLGTTGRSTGNLYATVDEHLAPLRRKWGADVVKTVVESRSAAVDAIEQHVSSHSIACDFRRTPFHLFVEESSPESEETIRDELEAMTEAGLRPALAHDLGLPFPVKQGIRVEGQAQIHPLKYVRGLARSLPGACRLFEHSRVMEIDQAASMLRTARGSVRAKHIVMATHTPKGFHLVQTLLGPMREFGVAAELAEDAIPPGIFWRIDRPKRSIRSFRSDGVPFALAIGESFKTGQNERTLASIQRLEEYLTERLPVRTIRYRWGAQAYRSADGLPFIGRYGDRLHLMTGFASDGLVYGTLAAMIVSEEILGRESPWRGLYRADRFTPLKSAARLVKQGAANFLQYLRRLPGGTGAKRLEDVGPDEGRLIERDGEKLAVHRDAGGELHVVSAVCTHLGCIVRWNRAEHSWDCPCHGSRFSADGEVIEGPAMRDLPRK